MIFANNYIKTMALIEIKGIIGDEYSYSAFLTDYAKAGQEPIRLTIDSVGGDVLQGEAIAAFISQHSDRFISVHNNGAVASIAASIFLALPREKRFFDMSKGIFLIHNPFADPMSMVLGGADTTADGLAMIADQLTQHEANIAKFIVKQTGADLDVVKGLMKVNEPLTEDQMNALNIATVYRFQAVAYYKPNNEDKMTKEELAQELQQNNVTLFGVIKAWMKKTTKFVAIVLTDANGATIEFPDVPDGVEPVVGDTARYTDGTIPTGDVLMADGKTVVFDNGVVTEIKAAEPVEEPTEEPTDETLTAQLEAVKAELAATKAEAAKVKAELVTVKAQIVTKPIVVAQVDPPAPDGKTKVRSLAELRK